VRLAFINRAARTIQAAWYRYQRKRVLLFRKEQIKYTNAAIKIQKLWRGYQQHKYFKNLLDSCRYEDEDDFDYGGSVIHCTTNIQGVDEAEFMIAEDLDLEFSFPSSFAVHSKYLITNWLNNNRRGRI
jgi:hypothetical protein